MRKFVSISLFFFLAACASVHGNLNAVHKTGVDLPVKITAQEVEEYSDHYHRMIDFTFENTSGRWMRFEDVEFDFSNAMGVEHNIIVGEDLKAWAESYRIKKSIENYNDSLGIAATILTGAFLTVASTFDSNAARLGMGMQAAGTGVALYKGVSAAKLNAQVSSLVPDGHAYRSFSIPPKGFARRWMLVNTPQKMIVKKFTLSLKSVEKGNASYTVPLKEIQ